MAVVVPVNPIDDREAPRAIALPQLAAALALTVVICAAAHLLADRCGELCAGSRTLRSLAGNAYLWITVLTMVVATVAHRQLASLRDVEVVGTWLLYVFLFVIGLPADLVKVLQEVPSMFAFCAVIAVVNLAVTLALGRLFRLPLEELLVAVNATLGGAPSAAAMTIAKGWSHLVLPAILVAIWGYVIGTFLGIGICELLRGLL